jgi:mono/diheme cytochrome c family protein
VRRWLTRRSRIPAVLRATAALVLAAGALIGFAAPGAPGQTSAGAPGQTSAGAPGQTSAGAPGQTGAGAPPSNEPNAPDKLPAPPGPGNPTRRFPTSPALVAQGYNLYQSSCSSCHGIALEGQHGIAPSLRGVGPGPVDFYLSTGRMPLQSPRDQPVRG